MGKERKRKTKKGNGEKKRKEDIIKEVRFRGRMNYREKNGI